MNFVCPFSCQWTFGLFLVWGYYEHSCYEQPHTIFHCWGVYIPNAISNKTAKQEKPEVMRSAVFSQDKQEFGDLVSGCLRPPRKAQVVSPFLPPVSRRQIPGPIQGSLGSFMSKNTYFSQMGSGHHSSLLRTFEFLSAGLSLWARSRACTRCYGEEGWIWICWASDFGALVVWKEK